MKENMKLEELVENLCKKPPHKKSKKLQKYKLYLYLNANALGDIVASIPIVKRIMEISEDVFVIIPPQFKELFWFVANDRLCTDKVKGRKGYTIRKLNYIENKMYMNCPICEGKISAVVQDDVALFLGASKLKLTEYASLNLIKESWDLPYLKFPKIAENRYSNVKGRVLLQSSFRTPTRRFYDYQIQKMIQKLNEKGLEPVLVGKIDNPTQFQGNFLDVRNRTELIDMMYLFQNNKSFICLDSGLYHMSQMTDIKAICCFTNINPRLRIPIDSNVEIIETKSACRYCGTDMHYMNIGEESCVLDKDYECVKRLDIDEIIKAVD